MTDRGLQNVISAVAHAFQPRAKETLWDSGNQGAERKGNIVEDLLGASGALRCLEKTTSPHSRIAPSPRDPLSPLPLLLVSKEWPRWECCQNFS